MNHTKHPHLDLIINEDGTLLNFQGKTLKIHTYRSKMHNYDRRTVHFKHMTVSVAKLVCEAWNGMRDSPEQSLHRRDKNPDNDHYTNLYWDTHSGKQTARTKRASSSKIKNAEIPEVIKRIESGETLKNIGKAYNTSDMSISRIKKRYMTDQLMMLKDKVRNSKSEYDRKESYALYLGFATVSEAIGRLGKKNFKNSTDKIALRI